MTINVDPGSIRVAVFFEATGTVRRALADLGFDAWSIDLRPASDGSNKHIVGDARDHLHDGWHFIVVCHPPCTRLCRSGRRWLSGKGKMTPPKSLPRGRTWESLQQEFEEAVDLFSTFWKAPVPHIAIENPRMHDLAIDRMPADLPKPDVVQPFWFGDPEYKATGWYLKNLPPLMETNRLKEPERDTPEWKAWNRVHRMARSKTRGLERSRFFPGMAAALAQQWGDTVLQYAAKQAA